MIFYDLANGNEFDVEFAYGNDWEGIECSINPGHKRPGNRVTDLRIELPSSKIPHFMWTLLSDCIITDEVVKLLKKAGFTGFILKPVVVEKVKRGKKDDIPSLWELIITGRGGEAHPDSGIYLIETCEACDLRQYSSYKKGIVVDENQWDGSDFFSVTGYPRHILVTERVKDFIITNRLKNCTLTPSHELRWPERVIRPEDVVTKKRA